MSSKNIKVFSLWLYLYCAISKDTPNIVRIGQRVDDIQFEGFGYFDEG